MGASDLLARLSTAGIRLSIVGPGQLGAEPRDALTDEIRALLRENKERLLAALVEIGPRKEERRKRVLRILEERPELIKRAAAFDIDAEPDAVILTLAIRNVGTCELHIPRDKYSPWTILEALQAADQ